MMRKVLFLDIDGVLNNSSTPVERLIAEHDSIWILDPENVKWLNALVSATHTELIISSSWRHALTVEQIKAQMVKFGFSYPEKVTGATGKRISNPSIINRATKGIGLKISLHIPRAWEILEWLEANPVDHFVVLDDSPIVDSGKAHLDLLPIQNRTIRVNGATGLTEVVCNKVVNLLETDDARIAQQ